MRERWAKAIGRGLVLKISGKGGITECKADGKLRLREGWGLTLKGAAFVAWGLIPRSSFEKWLHIPIAVILIHCLRASPSYWISLLLFLPFL